MEIRRDTWLSDMLGRPVFSVVGLVDGSHTAGALVGTHGRENGPAMYDAKFPADRVDIARDLAAAGFVPVDVNVTLAIQSGVALPRVAGATGVVVREASRTEGEMAMDVAATSFEYSRFHLDPLIGRTAADRVKREWIRSYVERRRGEALLVAVRAGTVLGFLAVLDGRDGAARVRTIDLIGVAPAAQRQGVGRTLVASFISAYRASSDRLEVGTQVANVPSIALYERCGFTMRRARTVMHAHLGGAR